MLTIPEADFAAFIADLAAIIDLIHKTTKEIFIPIRISGSPIKPKDFVIVFRTSSKVQAIPLDGWFTTNISALAKKFVIKTFKTKDREFMNEELTEQLKDWYSKEKLSLVGGFQDRNNVVQLLFIKMDRVRSPDLEIFIE